MTNKMISFWIFGTVLSFCNIVPIASGYGRGSGIQCERITAPACQGLGYNMTAMPNLAGHTSQADAENMVNTNIFLH